ncbi:hypothetical protein BJ165DRAFT_1403455 [Panaeolus papilionaceus]|nr:hypothetical protein BJ165DRAFT_1403455 [Panaeolus papilionaceus]
MGPDIDGEQVDAQARCAHRLTTYPSDHHRKLMITLRESIANVASFASNMVNLISPDQTMPEQRQHSQDDTHPNSHQHTRQSERPSRNTQQPTQSVNEHRERSNKDPHFVHVSPHSDHPVQPNPGTSRGSDDHQNYANAVHGPPNTSSANVRPEGRPSENPDGKGLSQFRQDPTSTNHHTAQFTSQDARGARGESDGGASNHGHTSTKRADAANTHRRYRRRKSNRELEPEDTLNQVIERNEDLKRDVEAKEKWLRSANEQNEALRRTLEVVEKEQQQQVKQHEKESWDLHNTIHELEDRLRESLHAAQANEARLQSHIRELTDAQAFLTTADTYSGSDVTKMVEQLNAEIFQLSANLADRVEDSPTRSSERLSREGGLSPHISSDDFRDALGDRLLRYLQQKGPDIRHDTFLLQIALQALFTRWSGILVERFCGDQTGRDLLASIYRGIQEREIQAVSGRWRALTSQQISRSPGRFDEREITSQVQGLLIMCGCSSEARNPEFMAVVDESAVVINNMAQKIRAATKEGIISCDINTFRAEPSSRFDPALMIDCAAKDRGEVHSPKSIQKGAAITILCTVSIGLMKTTFKQFSNGTLQEEEHIILKPEVCLSATLAQYDQELQQSRASSLGEAQKPASRRA